MAEERNPAHERIWYGDDVKLELVGICHLCKHRTGATTCEAFPDGIPSEILTGDFDHHNPHPDDNGIQFEQLPA